MSCLGFLWLSLVFANVFLDLEDRQEEGGFWKAVHPGKRRRDDGWGDGNPIVPRHPLPPYRRNWAA